MRRFIKIIDDYIAHLEDEDSEEHCRSTFRRDKLGNRVEVPYGGTYKVGKNGRGVGIPRGYTSKADQVGQLHAIPPGQELKIGLDGTGQLHCPGKPNPPKKPVNQKQRSSIAR